MNLSGSWLDRTIGAVAPKWALTRLRARVAAQHFQRTYDAATESRRTQGWRRSRTDANTVLGPSIAKLRDAARDLVRNNAYAESALNTIADHTVGWGIKPVVKHEAFERWANSTDCDADGQHDLAGLQKLVMRTVAESGECLVRRRFRRLDDGFALPLQLQVLEPDFLDTSKDLVLPNGAGRIVQGVQMDATGYRTHYWLFRDHPGSAIRSGGALSAASYPVPAESALLISKIGRPGQVRSATWFAPVLVLFNDFAELSDATLMKQKISACLSIITSDVDGTAAPLGSSGTAPDGTTPTDSLEPGMILNVAPGRNITAVQPPTVREYPDYAKTLLHAMATGLGVTYEDLTGDYQNLPFSAARMSRIRHWAHVDDWRYRMLIPQFLNPIWGWAMQACELAGIPTTVNTGWTPPPMPMIEPDKEGLAVIRNVRGGAQTLSDVIRERGYTRDAFLDELQADFEALDKRGLILDCDPRKVSQQGQMHPEPGQPARPEAPLADEATDEEAA